MLPRLPSAVAWRQRVIDSRLLACQRAQVKCTLAAYLHGGFNLPVTVTVDGQSATQNYLSFQGSCCSAWRVWPFKVPIVL